MDYKTLKKGTHQTRKVKFDENGNPNINVASLYPSVAIDIDGSRIVDQYETEEGWVIEI